MLPGTTFGHFPKDVAGGERRLDGGGDIGENAGSPGGLYDGNRSGIGRDRGVPARQQEQQAAGDGQGEDRGRDGGTAPCRSTPHPAGDCFPTACRRPFLLREALPEDVGPVVMIVGLHPNKF